jgi:non-haem Fe2+, alpha-ketoglutarate-dependent halogenase
MPGKLAEAHVAQYRRDGFCFPIPAFSPEEVIDLRKQLETFETRQGQVLQGTQRLKTSLLLTWVDRLIRAPQILDPVEDLIGPNILCWGVHFWIKESKTIDYVSWHQDHQYWGLDSAEIVTAWVAFSPATIESGGCVAKLLSLGCFRYSPLR